MFTFACFKKFAWYIVISKVGAGAAGAERHQYFNRSRSQSRVKMMLLRNTGTKNLPCQGTFEFVVLSVEAESQTTA
jgi:hypothetical protein